MLANPPKTKKRKPRKPTKAERAQADAYAKLLDKWSSVPKFARQSHPKLKARDRGVPLPDLSIPEGRNLKLQTGKAETTFPVKKGNQQYTGTKMLGVATMHKSNQVPIFSSQEAIEVSKMRRS